VLHHGKLIEQGTHAELIRLGGSYAKLCEATFASDSQPTV
jgi:ABC-type multidrug transport system fused ATPase/permease subunit